MKKGIAIALAIIVMYLLFFIAGQAQEPEEICPYRYLLLTPTEERELANLLYCEVGSFEFAGKGDVEEGRRCAIATCQVILNRFMSERFTNGSPKLASVTHSRSQFSTYPAFLYVDAPDYIYEVMYSTLMGEDLQIGYDVYFFAQGLNPGTEFVTRIGGHTFSK